MACSTSEYDVTKDVWTKGTTTDDLFVPLLKLATTDAARVKLSYLALGSAGLLCRRAWRYSNDGVTWTSVVAIGGLYAAEGSWQWSTGYFLTLTNYQWVEYGIISKNSGGTVMESGRVRALFSLRDDKLSSFGAPPTSWGTLDAPTYALSRVTADLRITYYAAADPFGDVYDVPGATWSLAAVSSTVGDPSGPGAWDTYPVWLGYDDTAQAWKVYSNAGGTINAVGSSLAGDPQAVARVSVASGTATFQVSFDGVQWTTLHTQVGTWTYRIYVVQNATFFTVYRELRS